MAVHLCSDTDKCQLGSPRGLQTQVQWRKFGFSGIRHASNGLSLVFRNQLRLFDFCTLCMHKTSQDPSSTVSTGHVITFLQRVLSSFCFSSITATPPCRWATTKETSPCESRDSVRNCSKLNAYKCWCLDGIDWNRHDDSS